MWNDPGMLGVAVSAGRGDPYGLLGDGGDMAAALDAVAALDAALHRLAIDDPCRQADPNATPLRSTNDNATTSDHPCRQVRSGDACFECSGALIIQDLLYECLSCHAVFEAADFQDVLPFSIPEIVGASAFRPRLRMVGREARWFQPDLDRTNPSESSEIQKKSTYQELLKYNREYANNGGNPFPLNILDDVANTYNVVQKQTVKRSMLKREILATLVFYSCLHRKFTRTKTEVAGLLQLHNLGIARGEVFLRSIDEDHHLGIDMNGDRLQPHLTSVFAQLGMSDAAVTSPLRVAIAAIIDKAIEANIGFRSVLRSKAIATTYEVLWRKGLPVGIDVLSGRCGIRIHTIRQFLNNLAEFHSHFVEIYRSLGLIVTRR